jgi:hypothetical protein
MKNLLKITLALTFASFAAGCSDASKEVEKYADKMCACKDAACADKVMAEFGEWAKKNKDAKGDEDKAAKAGEKLFKCAMDKGASMEKMTEALKGLE